MQRRKPGEADAGCGRASDGGSDGKETGPSLVLAWFRFPLLGFHRRRSTLRLRVSGKVLLVPALLAGHQQGSVAALAAVVFDAPCRQDA